MRHSVRRTLPALLIPALFVGCDQGLVDARTPEISRVRNMDQPMDETIDNPGEFEGGGLIDGGGGFGGGGTTTTTTEPFAPPPPPFFLFDPLPTPTPTFTPAGVFTCGDVTHPFWGIDNGWSNDITRGTTLYFSGIVVPGTQMGWGIYNTSGNLVKAHRTQPARSNCVVHHEPEAVSTWDLAPGYYHVYASYWGLERYGSESSTGVARHYPRYVGPLRIR
jgi:hypothetical protein